MAQVSGQVSGQVDGQVDDWQDVNQQLEMLLALDSAERQRSLGEIGQQDAPREARLRRLLAGIASSQPLEELESVVLVQEALQSLETLGTGDQLGEWTLQACIGRGGMAEVFEATREVGGAPQRAALKLMAMGLGSEEQRRRFRQETAILARLQDPRLSRLIDAGSAPDSRPWLAMEYIDGLPIDQACEQAAMGLRQRVSLLIEVARAVDSCHRALVVHRDIKPSNVFVTAQGQVRLLDFGIAKVVEPQAGGGLATQFTAGAYTLRFCSPEQLQSRPTGVDCDVYQLGLLAFLLLTGQRAFQQHEGEALALLRAMREGAPLPSSVKSASGQLVPWARQLRGDLDAVILRALQFDSSERYPGARDFADDLQNWLERLPVSARSHGAWYRSQRYLRRHWLGASSIALIFLLVSGYSVTLTWQSKRLAEQRNAAETAQLRAESIRDFLLQVFGSVDPQSQLSRGKTIEQLLIEGVESARMEYADQPLLAAQLLYDMGDVLSRRGRLDEARLAFEDARRMRAEALGADHPETLVVAELLGEVLYHLGEGQASLDLLRRHLEDTERVFGTPSDAVINALAALAPVESVYGDIASAEAQSQRALELQAGLYPDGLPAPEQPLSRALLLNQLGVVLMRAQRFEEAAPYVEQSLGLYEQHAGRLDSRTLKARKNLAYLYRSLKLADQAQELFEQTLRDERELYDGAHWQIAYSLGHLANMATDAEDYEQAIKLWEEAEAETRAAMGDDYYWVDSARINRAKNLMLIGRQGEGKPVLLEIANSPDSAPTAAQRARDLLAQYPAD